jgi:very-short-patch-repair endonuclease
MKNRTSLARNLRSETSPAERKLWSRLRDRRFLGLKFKRQVPIDQFVVDFASVEAKLIIEVDGGPARQTEGCRRTASRNT